jgi:polysaccharide biosynthesis/export protein
MLPHRNGPMTRRFAAFLLALLTLLTPLASAAQGDPGELVLRAGDALRVFVWREADLSGEFIVDETGHVTLPMLGQVVVAGRSIAALRDELLAGYARELRNPSITVTPLRRVNVLGEVNRPGIFSVDPTVALADLLAMAGGATVTGDLRHIQLVRNGQVMREQLDPGLQLSLADVRSGDQIFVGRRSWFDRNSGFLISSLFSAVLSVTASLIIAGSGSK